MLLTITRCFLYSYPHSDRTTDRCLSCLVVLFHFHRLRQKGVECFMIKEVKKRLSQFEITLCSGYIHRLRTVNITSLYQHCAGRAPKYIFIFAPKISETSSVIAQLVKWVGFGLDDPGFENQQGQEIFPFPKTTQTGSRAHPASIKGVSNLFTGAKAACAWSWLLTFIYCQC